MKKEFDKNRPDTIKLHEKDKKLAKKFIEVNKLNLAMKKKLEKMKHETQLATAKKMLAFDELEEKFKDELSIIAPEGQYSFHVFEEEVYITKVEQENIPSPFMPPSMPKELKDNMKSMIDKLKAKGVDVKFGGVEITPDGKMRKFGMEDEDENYDDEFP